MAHDFTSSGTVLSGANASTDPSATKLPEWGKPDFYLMHYPTAWEAVEVSPGEYEWLPKLKPLLLQPGVNGVRALRGGGTDDSAARMNFMDRGWKILSRDLGYVVRYPARRGHSHYARWDIPHVMGNRVIVRRDDEEYNEFRRDLVLNGVLEAPEPEALELILEDMGTRINRNAQQIHLPTVAAKVEKTKAKIAGAKKAAPKAAKKRAPRKRNPKGVASV